MSPKVFVIYFLLGIKKTDLPSFALTIALNSILNK